MQHAGDKFGGSGGDAVTAAAAAAIRSAAAEEAADRRAAEKAAKKAAFDSELDAGALSALRPHFTVISLWAGTLARHGARPRPMQADTAGWLRRIGAVEGAG